MVFTICRCDGEEGGAAYIVEVLPVEGLLEVGEVGQVLDEGLVQPHQLHHSHRRELREVGHRDDADLAVAEHLVTKAAVTTRWHLALTFFRPIITSCRKCMGQSSIGGR